MKRITIVCLIYMFGLNLNLLSQWEPDIRLTNDPAYSFTKSYYNHTNNLAVKNNIVHVVWSDQRDGGSVNDEIYYKRSIDGGTSWGNDIRLTNNVRMSYDPAIVTSNTALHVIWEDFSNNPYKVYYKRSIDEGITWSPDIQLTNSWCHSHYPAIASSGNYLHLVYGDCKSGHYEIYYRRSDDEGLTWGSEVMLTNADNFNSEAPSITVNGSEIHVVWDDDRFGPNQTDIYYKHSLDNGVTWSAETHLNNNIAKYQNPVIAVSGDVVHALWADAYRNNGVNISYKRSIDKGITWSNQIVINQNGFGCDPSVSVCGSNVHVVWEDRRDGVEEIYYNSSVDGGVNWGNDTRLTYDPASSYFPCIFAEASGLHLVWTEYRDGNDEIYYKRNPTGNICTGCEVPNYIWEKVGNTPTELNSTVNAYCMFNNKLIAGGTFANASGNVVNHIASWNGSIWEQLDNGLTGGSPYAEVDALTVFQNKVMAGGRFLLAGSTVANNIAQWDGNSWTSVGTGSGNGTDGRVYSLAVHNNKLIVGGVFTTAGGIPASNIAQWDGSNWTMLGSGVSGDVRSLLSFNNNLYAGGVFSTAGSVTANNIAKWDGSNWSSLGSGMTLTNGNGQGVGALANYNNNLIAAGRFNNAGGVPVNFIAKWNGSSWSDIGGGFPGSYEGIYALYVSNNALYAGGSFVTAGANNANSIAKWNGSGWSALGNGITNFSGQGIVLSLTNYNNYLFAGGEFTSPDYSWIASNLCETVIPIGIEPGNITIPKTYYLSQNYPNPFNPSTRISFSLPEKSFVTLRVYDMLGREIAELVNNELNTGNHSINWNASAYPSGVYFYKIEAGTFVESKKMVLIK